MKNYQSTIFAGAFFIFSLFFNLTAKGQISPVLTEESASQIEIKAQELSRAWNRESYQSAVDSFVEASQIWNALGRTDKASSCLREAGRLSLSLGEKKSAHSYFLQSLQILPEDNLVERIKTLSRLSSFYYNEGKKAEAERKYKQALALAEICDNHSAKAEAFFSAAEFFYLGDTSESINFYKQAIAAGQKDNDLEGEAKSLIGLGYAYLFENNYELALETLNQSLEQWKKLNDIRGQAITHIALGNFFSTIDKKQSSLNNYKIAESLFPDGLDFIEKARIYNGLGSIYENYMEWELSISCRKDALRLFEQENHVNGQMATLVTLASLCDWNNKDEAALDYFQRAQKMAEEHDNALFLAVSKQNLGFFYYNNNQPDEALDLYRQASRLLEKTDFARHISINDARIGQVYERQGNLPLARKFYRSSLELNKKVQDKFAEAEILANLARLDALENKTEDAISLLKDSIELTESLSTDVFNAKLKTTYFSSVFDRYELYINLLMKMHRRSPGEDYVIRALQAAEKSRARSMLETLALSEADFFKDADAETVRREKEIRALLNIKADNLTDLLSSSDADKSAIDKIKGETKELENELEEIKTKLKQSSPIYSAIKNPPPFDVGEFQNNILDENTLLLEFSFGKDESYLWLVGKNEVDAYVLPPRGEIETHIENLRALFASRDIKQSESVADYQKRLKESESAYEREALALSEKLFGQIAAGRLAGKRLIIVPDGKLHYFPVSPLPLPNAENNAPLLLTNETVYEPSAQTLTLLKKSRNNSPADKNFLVFSDPVFSGDDARLSGADKTPENAAIEIASSGHRWRSAESLDSLPRLPASKAEADAITEIIGSKAESFSGFAATREQFLNDQTSDYKIIHFATHGLVNEQHPELSGIVFSRFDQTGRQLDESVRLHDIYGLKLNADLVVLSACNTGFGKEVKGEGLMSLKNAFLQVGAKSVLSSLWKVDDDATKELMKDFYQNLTAEKLTSSEALRRAQIKLSQNPRYKSPFYWSAFTVQGDFENKPQLSQDFGWRIYFLLIIPLLLLLLTLTGIYDFGKARLFNRKIVKER